MTEKQAAPPDPADESFHGSELHRRLRSSPLMRLVGLAGQAVGHTYKSLLAEEAGLSPGAAAVLGALAWGQGRGLDHGPPGRATHTQLAQRCLITPATLTGIVSTLEKADYVHRERDQTDRRVVWLLITDSGLERAKQFGARAASAEETLLRSLTPELEATVREFLITVIENNLAAVQEFPPGSCRPPGESADVPDLERPQF